MKEKYFCDFCNAEFDNKSECEQHEENCQATSKFTCDCCGKVIEFVINPDHHDFKINECWSFSSGRAGYGSKLDGCDIRFDLCDDCLLKFINSFTLEGQAKIHNSGSNQFTDNETWVKWQKGLLTDEELEENGLYSPRQINAYKERFSTCDKVYIIKSSDSTWSRCPRLAMGDENGNANETNCDTECFECEAYKKRAKDGKLEVVPYEG